VDDDFDSHVVVFLFAVVVAVCDWQISRLSFKASITQGDNKEMGHIQNDISIMSKRLQETLF